ncbi:Vms1/Ankzf1 family peptidyl-tRNA hydrolase [Jatrophihabitans sp.]|uniref:baeRF2 domain-containing protein n=1 Tax=Jatrophihabitans sp. TaxID=1932789 RepID=UPI002B51ED20|nr:Vms1/Ankzf1 family peptidyl-tRNA hydrolase [Jatrophihabitans sp.]
MQIPTTVSALYSHPGPFASVYLDATRASESGSTEVELRWRALRGQLAEAGADDKTLQAIDEVAGAHAEIAGRHGQFVVAADGEVLLDEPTRRPPLRELARWAPLPHVLPYLVDRSTQIPHLTVLIDRTGADVHTVLDDLHSEQTSVAGGTEYPLRKTGRDVWNERVFQNRVDNAWETNSKEVAQAIVHNLPSQVQVVLLAGDVRARTLVSEELAKVLPQRVGVRQLEHGARAEGASREALDAEVRSALLHHLWAERHDVLARLQQAVGRHDYAVTGIPAVLDALRKAQVDTLVLSDDPSSTASCAIGPEPLLLGSDMELSDLGVTEIRHERLDAALVRALAGSGAGLVITPGGHQYVEQGIAALLRYTDASTPT